MTSDITLSRPLTIDEIRELTKDGADRLNVFVKVSLNALIVKTMEELNDLMNDLILPDNDMVGLSDIAYAVHEVIPAEPTIYGGGSVVLLVSADANDVLDDSWEEDDDTLFWEAPGE